MSKIVRILAPRLDLSFKKPLDDVVRIPKEYGPIPDIRKHWVTFFNMLIKYHTDNGDKVDILEAPLWCFEPSHTDNVDMVYIPHRDIYNFESKAKETLYYMQSVFPFLFTVDSKGWGPRANKLTDRPHNVSFGGYDILRKWYDDGGTKFPQCNSEANRLPERFVFFPCQLPHDEVILRDSSFSMIEALEIACMSSKRLDIPLVVKGHPVNPGSMVPLKNLCMKYDTVTWVNDVHIKECIDKSIAVIVVNSGVGFEALLAQKPVASFGRSEYQHLTAIIKDEYMLNSFIIKSLNSEKPYNNEVINFFNLFYDTSYDTRDIRTFDKRSV